MSDNHRTSVYGNSEIDKEISDVLIAISVIARRLADKIEKIEKKGVDQYGKNE